MSSPTSRGGPAGRQGGLERCAARAEDRGDPMLGTAFPAARVLLIEQPGPWGRDGLRDSRLDPAVSAGIERRARAAGVRAPAVRRPGRSDDSGAARRWALVDTRDEHVQLRTGTVDTTADLLDLPLDGRGGEPDHEPLFLVCTHGRHDACCALRGRGAAAALEAMRPGRVWECSHVGGDRFAANVLVLPAGLLYGRVLPSDAADVIAAGENDEVLLRRLRGRVGLPPAAQAALAYAHARLGVTRHRALRVTASDADQDGTVSVRLNDGTERYDVTVRVERVAQSGLTCANPGPSSYLAYRPQAISRVP